MARIWPKPSQTRRVVINKRLKYLSVCSGIEAATVAWHPLGWEPVAFSEIEKFPSAVLAHHYEVPNLGDMTLFRDWDEDLLAEVDLIVGGTPCQAFSVAGLRGGLDDERGNLSLVFVHLVEHIDAIRLARGKSRIIILWENVPGVLSDSTGAFGSLLGALAGEDDAFAVEKWPSSGVVDGESRRVAWAVLDAQYFGVPQRRRRVFALALPAVPVEHTGNWPDPAEVLSLSQSLCRHPAPRREAGKAAPTTPSRSAAGGGLGTGFDCDGGLIPDVANPLTARMHKGINTTLDEGQTPIVTHALRGEGFDASEDGTGRGTPLVAFNLRGREEGSVPEETDLASVRASSGGSTNTHIADMAVRRLTVTECERLMGFPDGYTNIPGASDSGRYKALGNSMAVRVMRWIGERIAATDTESSDD